MGGLDPGNGVFGMIRGLMRVADFVSCHPKHIGHCVFRPFACKRSPVCVYALTHAPSANNNARVDTGEASSAFVDLAVNADGLWLVRDDGAAFFVADAAYAPARLVCDLFCGVGRGVFGVGRGFFNLALVPIDCHHSPLPLLSTHKHHTSKNGIVGNGERDRGGRITNKTIGN